MKSAMLNWNKLELNPLAGPKDMGIDGMFRTADVTPDTVFWIGFNKAFNSSFREVAAILITRPVFFFLFLFWMLA